MLLMLRQLILYVPLSVTLLVGTPMGTFRLQGDSEESPASVGEESSSVDAVPSSVRTMRRNRYVLCVHCHAQPCANCRSPASASAGLRLLALDGHRLSNGLRAPLLT